MAFRETSRYFTVQEDIKIVTAAHQSKQNGLVNWREVAFKVSIPDKNYIQIKKRHQNIPAAKKIRYLQQTETLEPIDSSSRESVKQDERLSIENSSCVKLQQKCNDIALYIAKKRNGNVFSNSMYEELAAKFAFLNKPAAARQFVMNNKNQIIKHLQPEKVSEIRSVSIETLIDYCKVSEKAPTMKTSPAAAGCFRDCVKNEKTSGRGNTGQPGGSRSLLKRKLENGNQSTSHPKPAKAKKFSSDTPSSNNQETLKFLSETELGECVSSMIDKDSHNEERKEKTATEEDVTIIKHITMPRYNLMFRNRVFDVNEWKKIWDYIGHHNIYHCILDETTMSTVVKNLRIVSSKNNEEIKFDFVKYALVIREKLGDGNTYFPSHIKQFTQEIAVFMFESILKEQHLISVVSNMLRDGIVCEAQDPHYWIKSFCNILATKESTYFYSDQESFEKVRDKMFQLVCSNLKITSTSRNQ